MTTQLIHDRDRGRGRGPEISETRITVYTLLPHFLDPKATEADICQLYDLNAKQVAAARAYVFQHADDVFEKHLIIEAKLNAKNSPGLIERAEKTRTTFSSFKRWLAQRERVEAQDQSLTRSVNAELVDPKTFPTFLEWLADRESGVGEGS